MEEYEPHVARGNVVYSGVDYEAILRALKMILTDVMLLYGTVVIMTFLSLKQTYL